MTQQITKGIKVSVTSSFNGSSYRNRRLYYIFEYTISIDNNSKNTVQLTDRFWKIYDALNHLETVKGRGVVGQTPILVPGDSYTYQSGCYLASNMGAMKGYYIMKNIHTNDTFKVYIPIFQLISPLLLN